MPYITGVDRHETQLLPPSVEEYVAVDAPVRVIDAFVEQLDLKTLEFLAPPKATGRPSYHPRTLLKIYLYGYLHRVRSSRRLEAQCTCNLELIWLTGNLRPDHWTLAAFRREHHARFKTLFREFNLLCRKLELFGAELVAIDGAKFKAVNSPRRHYTAAQLAECLARIDARIEEYLEQLDTTDAEHAELPAAQLETKLVRDLDRQVQLAAAQAHLLATGQTEISLTDPDSRGQKKVGVGYNVQTAVDDKHHLIAAQTVEQAANDMGQLAPMATAAQAELGATTTVADAGYHERTQLKNCEDSGLTTYVPAPANRSGHSTDGRAVYPKTQFTYDAAQDAYRCPAGQTLPRAGEGEKHDKPCIYYYNTAACAACPQRAACTTAPYRKLSRLENEDVVERQAARVAARPEIVARRKTIVEHPFGTMRLWGHDEFLCRGLEMVRAEFSLTALTYNLRRALNICGVEKLLAALRPA